MIKFEKPVELNGEQLVVELNNAEIKINDYPVVDGNNNLLLDIADKDKTKASEIVKNHVGIDNKSELTIDQKLASVGLSIDDLKAALGL